MPEITFEFACRDDCLQQMFPSDLRLLVAERDRLRKEVEVLRLYGNKDCTAQADDALRRTGADSVVYEIKGPYKGLLTDEEAKVFSGRYEKEYPHLRKDRHD